MTSKFDLRRGLLLGAFGSGLAAVLASCESAYRGPQVFEEPVPEPDWNRRPVHPQRRVIYRRKKLPSEAVPDSTASGPTPSTTVYPTGGGGGGGGGGSGGGSGGGGGWSDRRLKTDIHALGHSPSGLPIYQFRYVWGGPIYVGVMAQDLLETRPEAVIVTDSGYLMVDYDLIDVRMMTLANYEMSAYQLGH
ncbi:hypothetical protein GCM10007874_46600 [Labrys miyagiensis]|uniref:Peptidase S74 domain-containing protein n=1 Tax=Labrys miyagiensis TaxID=346912 RepID=A0ABQ6CMV9_9HYPH|nr:tail fiber domain-containing protein [Labrys miyagiensis]GLS21643.1 hypothetical protein GCM10007874_46600 [Labrys miyagiensis]